MQNTDAVVIERTFDASIDLIWSLWVEPRHFEQWYGPPGFAVEVVDYEVRVGGRRLLSMTSPDGKMTMWFVGEFRAVEAPAKLVYSDCMADAEGKPQAPSAMGMPGDEPLVTEVIVELESLEEGRCRMVMTHRGIPADSPGAKGWEMAFDEMARLVEEGVDG